MPPTALPSAARRAIAPLREFLVRKLKRDAGIDCTIDNILVTSGSLQALDLVNGVFLAPRRHRHHRAGLLPGHDQPLTRLGVNAVGIPLDRDGMRMDALASTRSTTSSAAACGRNTSTPSRRCRIRPAPSCRKRAASRCCGSREAHGVPIFEDDCYCRPDLGRQAAACPLRHEPARRASSISARSRSRSRRRCASATSSRRGS